MLDLLKQSVRSHRHKKIIELVNFREGDVVLDCSCGNGLFLSRLHAVSPGLRLFGIDASAVDIKKAQSGLSFAHFSKEYADKLSFNDATFNVAFSVMAFHHYDDPLAFLTEIFRVLKPTGILYLVDLLPKYAWSQKVQNRMGCTEPYHFERYYTREGLEEMLKQLGLLIDSDTKVTSLPQHIRLICVKRGEALEAKNPRVADKQKRHV